jgi:hypothetical protein
VRIRIAAVWLCVIAFAAGCAGPASEGEGVNEPPPFPGSVAATSWRTTEDPPEGFGVGGDRYDSPMATLEAMMTFGVQSEGGLPPGERLMGDVLDASAGTARAWIQLTGTADDSVAGQEILLSMDGRGWFIDRLAFRDHCRRGVDPAGDQCV